MMAVQHTSPTRSKEEVEETTTIPCAPTSSSGILTTARRRGTHVVAPDSDRSVRPTKSLDGFLETSLCNGDVILNVHPPLKQRIRRNSARRRKRRPPALPIETDSCTCFGVIAFVLVVLSTFSFVVMSVATIAVQHGLSGKHDIQQQYEKQNSIFQIRTKGAPSCSRPLTPEDVNFTLVTQFSDDRMWMMEYHCDRWGNATPISVVAFTNETVANITRELVFFGCDGSQLKVQTLLTDLYPPDDYPINVLRNMALSVVETTHVMYADIDFWEAENLHKVLNSTEIRTALAEDPKLALVVPAFQLTRQCREYWDCWQENIPMMPRTKDDMLKLLQTNQASPFDPTNAGGHGSTRYNQWIHQETNELIEIPCVNSNRYEPYLAFRYCDTLPPFQEAFSGYGKNKMTWVMHLRRAGFRFQQTSAFLTHYPHLDSISRLEWNKKPEELEPVVDTEGRLYKKSPTEVQSVDWQQYKRGQVDATFVQFREWLRKAIPNATKVARCVDAQDDDSRLWIDHHHASERETVASH